MIELISNSQHNNDVYIYLDERSSGKKYVRKISMTTHGNTSLKRENEGWSWYAQRRYSESRRPHFKLSNQVGWTKWEIDWIDGKVFQNDEGLLANKNALDQALDHYIGIWPSDMKSVPMHGDYSLVNLIFNSQGVHVIDWEYFNSSGPPWGYDGLKIIFESLWYSYIKHKIISDKEITYVVKCIKKLISTGNLNKDVVQNPLTTVRKWMTNYPELMERRKRKLPILQFTDEKALEIDKKIKTYLSKN